MAFCIGHKDEKYDCDQEALYCYDHAVRIGNAELKDECSTLRARLAKVEALEKKWREPQWDNRETHNQITAQCADELAAALEESDDRP